MKSEDHAAAICEIKGVTIAENDLYFKEVKKLFDRFDTVDRAGGVDTGFRP